MAVLVVGGAGYVGAHTCKALHRAGYHPVVLDDLSTGHESFVRWGPLVRADIRDTRAVVDALGTFKPDAVIHFAASAYVGESVRDPHKYYDNNVVGTLSLLKAMLQTGCLNIIFSSSCAVYGNCPDQPIREAEAPQPINPYGRSKLMVENILADYSSAYGLRSVALRYFNACGADPEGDLGELRNPETHLIPRALMAIQGHISDFVLYGNDYDTPDGTPVRDYVHVSDLAETHVLGLRWLLDGGQRAAFNLGSGCGYVSGPVGHAAVSRSWPILNH
jgi:UDP-glucose-4-epimerase GalE